MNELEFEDKLHALAQQLEYPRTPDIAGRVRARLYASPSPSGRGARGEGQLRFSAKAIAWSLTISLLLLSSILLIPPVRAAVIEFFQVGVVRIFPPTATPTAQTLPGTATPAISGTPTAPLPSLLPLLESITGQISLEEAQQTVGYPLLLPTYPAELGLPDRVYVQEAEGYMTIFVWMDSGQSDRVLMSLHFIPETSWAIKKMGPRYIQETTVNGQYAVWAEGTYPVLIRDGRQVEHMRLVDGHVLIWDQDGLTYRLESDLDMEEAIQVAESLAPIPER